MNESMLEALIEALLYEGYLLYPYRPSSQKNRTRFTFGLVYPEAYCRSLTHSEPSELQTQCLLRTSSPDVPLALSIRFLQPQLREICGRPSEIAGPEPEPVAELRVEGELYQPWQEALERRIELPSRTLREVAAASLEVPFSFEAARTRQPILDKAHRVAGSLLRRRAGVCGSVKMAAEFLGAHVCKITVRVVNQTPVALGDLSLPDEILLRTFASTHTVLYAKGAEFISCTNPPPDLADAVAACENRGTWPVLIGEEFSSEREWLLSAPIILYDFPKLAPESPGDLCDATEIDELLTLRILTLTDAEKTEMRGAGECARNILKRTESLSDEDRLHLHGSVRHFGNGAEDFFNPATRLASVRIGGFELKPGDRVRIRAKSRADVMDLTLSGKTAIIETFEQDAEGRVYLALVLDDDPGRDLGLMRLPGHRFFYGPDEVEPWREAY